MAYIPLDKDSFNGILMKKEISSFFHWRWKWSKVGGYIWAGFGGPNHEYENENKSRVWNKSSFDLRCEYRIHYPCWRYDMWFGRELQSGRKKNSSGRYNVNGNRLVWHGKLLFKHFPQHKWALQPWCSMAKVAVKVNMCVRVRACVCMAIVLINSFFLFTFFYLNHLNKHWVLGNCKYQGSSIFIMRTPWHYNNSLKCEYYHWRLIPLTWYICNLRIAGANNYRCVADLYLDDSIVMVEVTHTHYPWNGGMNQESEKERDSRMSGAVKLLGA